jgi:two-component system, OmpR family, sensor histidine kinase KdpD
MKPYPFWAGPASAVAMTIVCTLAGNWMSPRFDLTNIAMVYLLGVVIVALHCPRSAAVGASVLSVAALDYFFVPPRGRFTVDDAQYLLTFAIMLAVSLVISGLVRGIRMRASAQAALEIEGEKERIRSALLASISHDLRTPLAVMASASSSLAQNAERLSVEERRTLATGVFEQSRELSERVNKILQMTRLETGEMKVERDWASIGEIASSALSQLSERLSAHRVLVELPDDLPLVRVDAGLIEQVLVNLLDNAAKHTPAGTFIRVQARRAQGEIVVSVEDFSSGIPEEDVERIFEKFNRARLTDGGKGMGLGLPICRAIVRLHGGKAWAERISGGGTAFRFTLPAESVPSVPSETASTDE